MASIIKSKMRTEPETHSNGTHLLWPRWFNERKSEEKISKADMLKDV
jgi:hypothetical protein